MTTLTYSIGLANYEVNPYLIFVIMPFKEEWSDDVLQLIKTVGEKNGFIVNRVDDIFFTRNIINDVWQLISQAELIIAEITIPNANVFYELGIAHTLMKTVVHIRQVGAEDVPFDISSFPYIEYELNLPSKVEDFKNALSKILENYLEKKH